MKVNVRRLAVTIPVSSYGYVIRSKTGIEGRNLFIRYGPRYRLTSDVTY
jgi:hypothetical protein